MGCFKPHFNMVKRTKTVVLTIIFCSVGTTQLMLALIKGVVDMGVVLSLKTIRKSWQLCLSFKLDDRHPTRTKFRSRIIVCFSHSSLYDLILIPYNINCVSF